MRAISQMKAPKINHLIAEKWAPFHLDQKTKKK